MTPPSPSGAPTPQATESLTVAAPNIPAASAHLAERIAEEQRAYLHAFDTLMAEFFTRQRELLEGISAETLPLLEVIESLSTGGKRLRALLSYWGWRGAGGTPVTKNRASWSIVKAGMAVELFQTSALIHDDIIDRSDTRRGAPSVHKRFEAAHEQNSWRGDAFNYGLTGGILAGDLTLAWSAEVFASLGEGAIYGAPARTIFDRMRTEVLAGQYLDVYSEVLETEDAQAALQRALNVIRFKSAKYSCEHPFTIGGALALQAAALENGTGAVSEQHPVLAGYRAFGLPLGEGFQLRDDELGVFGQPEVTGKPAGDDLREGKRTVLVALTSAVLDEQDAALLHNSLGDPELSDEQVERIRELMVSSGAFAKHEQLIEQKSQAVFEALEAMNLDELTHAALTDIVGRALRRKA
ncbi:MAG: polyprenyl synthetase family protein [Rothia mucilaginosa]|nr:polyprenyl synthetase family protein [Rothia mucilaginosa]